MHLKVNEASDLATVHFHELFDESAQFPRLSPHVEVEAGGER